MSGERANVRTQDGVMDCYTFRPAASGDGTLPGPWPAVIVYMDAFGIRPQFAEMAERLASSGYLVVVPNLYYRTGAFAPFDPTQVAAEGPERDRFRGMIASIDNAKIMSDTAAVLQYVDANPAARGTRIGVVGYCMGGKFALSAAGTFPERVAAAASFHGGSLATNKPDSPHLLARRIQGKVYIGVAGIDPGFTEAEQDLLEQALNEAGVDYTIETYRHAKHGFAVNGHLVYDRDASERHWQKLLQLFRDNLLSSSLESMG
jgi:carboxymethylenebutenolidase